MTKNKPAINKNSAKFVAMLSIGVFTIQSIIVLIYIVSGMSNNNTAGLGRWEAQLGSLANTTLYIVLPLLIVGVVCSIIGARSYFKTHSKYSKLAFWFGVPSYFWLLVILGYISLIGLAFSAG